MKKERGALLAIVMTCVASCAYAGDDVYRGINWDLEQTQTRESELISHIDTIAQKATLNARVQGYIETLRAALSDETIDTVSRLQLARVVQDEVVTRLESEGASITDTACANAVALIAQKIHSLALMRASDIATALADLSDAHLVTPGVVHREAPSEVEPQKFDGDVDNPEELVAKIEELKTLLAHAQSDTVDHEKEAEGWRRRERDLFREHARWRDKSGRLKTALVFVGVIGGLALITSVAANVVLAKKLSKEKGYTALRSSGLNDYCVVSKDEADRLGLSGFVFQAHNNSHVPAQPGPGAGGSASDGSHGGKIS